MTPSTYAAISYHVPRRLSRRVSVALLSVNFMGWAVSSRSGEGAGLDLYARAVPREAMAALARLGLRPLRTGRISERRLLADVLPDEPCELARGVWIDPGRELEERAGRVVLRLPAIPAFGDGRHPTTRIGARLLRGARPRGRRVLDLGCGTGLLGVLAWRWGAESVAFSDIDADAVRSTRACCRVNGLRRALVVESDLLAAVPGAFDLVIANLYADVLLMLARDPRLDRALPRGQLLLSGVRAGRRAEVERAFARRGFALVATDGESEWCGMLLRRGAPG